LLDRFRSVVSASSLPGGVACLLPERRQRISHSSYHSFTSFSFHLIVANDEADSSFRQAFADLEAQNDDFRETFEKLANKSDTASVSSTDQEVQCGVRLGRQPSDQQRRLYFGLGLPGFLVGCSLAPRRRPNPIAIDRVLCGSVYRFPCAAYSRRR
jgi:hypothetical protein